MRTIIAGNRNCTDIKLLISAIDDCEWEITRVVCGIAKGADHLGELWAKFMGIPIDEFPANWTKYGKSASTFSIPKCN